MDKYLRDWCEFLANPPLLTICLQPYVSSIIQSADAALYAFFSLFQITRSSHKAKLLHIVPPVARQLQRIALPDTFIMIISKPRKRHRIRAQASSIVTLNCVLYSKEALRLSCSGSSNHKSSQATTISRAYLQQVAGTALYAFLPLRRFQNHHLPAQLPSA